MDSRKELEAICNDFIPFIHHGVVALTGNIIGTAGAIGLTYFERIPIVSTTAIVGGTLMGVFELAKKIEMGWCKRQEGFLFYQGGYLVKSYTRGMANRGIRIRVAPEIPTKDEFLFIARPEVELLNVDKQRRVHRYFLGLQGDCDVQAYLDLPPHATLPESILKGENHFFLSPDKSLYSVAAVRKARAQSCAVQEVKSIPASGSLQALEARCDDVGNRGTMRNVALLTGTGTGICAAYISRNPFLGSIGALVFGTLALKIGKRTLEMYRAKRTEGFLLYLDNFYFRSHTAQMAREGIRTVAAPDEPEEGELLYIARPKVTHKFTQKIERLAYHHFTIDAECEVDVCIVTPRDATFYHDIITGRSDMTRNTFDFLLRRDAGGVYTTHKRYLIEEKKPTV